MNRDYTELVKQKNLQRANEAENLRIKELEQHATPLYVAVLVLVLASVVFYALDSYVDRQVEKAQAVCLKGK